VFSVQLRALKYFLPLFASFIPLFLAQGRTVMIGLAVCFFLYFWFISGLKFHHKIAMFFVILSLLLMGVNLVEVDYLVRGILELSIGENGSVNVRLQKAFFVFDNFMKSPIIGQGANLEQYGRVKNIDSEYLLLLQRHGLIGLIFVVGTILLLMLKATKRLRFSLSAHMLLLLGGVALFVMLTNVFVFNIDTYGLFVIMIYLCVISKVRYPKKRFTSQSDFIFK
jgi:O-antigen ligase